jgi:uncharacterized protein (DUF849 family)
MYYTDDSILPENMAPLVITAAPFGPLWLPQDADIPVSWDEQVQTAVACFNAGATVLHVHVRNPVTGKGSVDLDEYNYFMGLLKKAVSQMILQVGGSISFSPKTDEAKAKWMNYDTRHMLTELDPKPEMVTVAVGTTQCDVISMMSKEDVKGTHWDDPKVQAAWSGMVVDATPKFGRNPFDWMEMVRRAPQGAVTFWTSMRAMITYSALAIVLGHHVRVGNEDNLWGANRKRMTSVDQIKGAVRASLQSAAGWRPRKRRARP